jgi:prepilin-type processing-associated H-X9-DG protein
MRRVVQAVVVVVILVVVGALLGGFIRHARTAAIRTQCSNNLKQLAIALHIYHDTYKHFPPGTVAGSTLPPDQRLSWLTEVYPCFMEGGIMTDFERTKAWDAPENNPPHWKHRVYPVSGGEFQMEDCDVPVVGAFACPANSDQLRPGLPSFTHYVGIAGVGDDAPELRLADPRAGFFGYDRKMKLSDIRQGTESTLMLGEVVAGGPWTAGGRATAQGVTEPYFGDGGQFNSWHGSANFAFVDGSVRALADSVSPRAIEAMARIAGSE